MSLAFAAQAQAADIFTGLGGASAIIPNAGANGISADGSTVVGVAPVGANFQAYRWVNGAMTNLGAVAGLVTSRANATSADGSVVVGESTGAGGAGTQAFRWVGGVMTGLGYLPGSIAGVASSTATAVSANGSIVVGYSTTATTTQAFRWAGGVMTNLGVLKGYAQGLAYGVSADGSIIVGTGFSPLGTQAFRWTQATGMTGLGYLPTDAFSEAYGISADGTTIVGLSGATTLQAVRWKGGVATGLGLLPGDTASRANAVSADGSVVVGTSYSAATSNAFRWTQSGGMASVVNWLSAAGVAVPAGWNLTTATGVSGNGNVVVGNGTDPNGLSQPWLARVGPANGILTDLPAFNRSLTRDLADLPNLTMFGAHHRTLLDNGLARTYANGTCGWAVVDSANQKTSQTSTLLAEVGVCQDIGNTRLGIGIGQQSVRQAPATGGSSRYDGQSLVVEAAHAFANGIQPSITGYVGRFSTQLSRGYLNGATPDSSNASPKAATSALRLRLDFKNIAEVNGLSFSPYVAYTRENIRLDPYTETGGGFPAQFSASTWRIDNIRIGSAARIALSDSTDLRIGMEAVHNISNTGTGVTGNVIGLWGFAQSGQKTSQNGIRFMVDADHRISPSTALTFGVNASTSTDSTWGATTGLWSSL